MDPSALDVVEGPMLARPPPREEVAAANQENEGGGDDDSTTTNNNGHAVLQGDREAAAAAAYVNRFRAEDDLDRILTQFDPDRMKLTPEEHQWATEIKEKIETMPEMNKLTDFMYAQLAIVCKRSNMKEVIRRCQGLQDFRQEYKVLDELSEGRRYVPIPFTIFPEYYLSFSFNRKDGTYVCLLDVSKFEPNKKFTSPKLADEWLKAMFYWFAAFCPDFESIRKGVIHLVECQDMAIMRPDVLKYGTMLFTQLACNYPMQGPVRHYNTGTMMNVMCSLLRRLLPDYLKDTYEVGLKFDGNLRHVFLTPTVEAANKRMLDRLQETLKLRYQNATSFTLK